MKPNARSPSFVVCSHDLEPPPTRHRPNSPFEGLRDAEAPIKFLRICCALLLGLALPLFCAATTYTWNPTSGTTDNWSANASWSGGAAPATGSGSNTFIFGTGSYGSTANMDKGYTLGQLTFSGGTMGYSITGTNVLTLNSGITQSSAYDDSIATPITLGGNNTWQTTSGTLTLTGATNLNNKTLTISNGLVTTGAFSGPGTMNISSGASVSWGTSFSDNKLTLALNGGSLLLNNTSYTIGNLNVTSNSVIDFGSGGSTLNVAILTISAGVTLTINNYVSGSDSWNATTFTGSTKGTNGTGTETQIAWAQWSSGTTEWDSSGNIYPVPEVPGYGFIFSALSLVFCGFRYPGARRLVRDSWRRAVRAITGSAGARPEGRALRSAGTSGPVRREAGLRGILRGASALNGIATRGRVPLRRTPPGSFKGAAIRRAGTAESGSRSEAQRPRRPQAARGWSPFVEMGSRPVC